MQISYAGRVDRYCGEVCSCWSRSEVDDGVELADLLELLVGGSLEVAVVLDVLSEAGEENHPSEDVDAVDDNLVPSSSLVLGVEVVDGGNTSIGREAEGVGGCSAEDDETDVIEEGAEDAATPDTKEGPEAHSSHAEAEEELDD